MGVGRIPASAIDRHVAGWSDEDAEMFEVCVRRMDEAYLMKSNKTEEAEQTGSARDAFRDATAARRAG